MVTDFEKAFEMGKFLVYKQEKNIAEAMTAVRLFVTGAIFALSPHELELIEVRLIEHFEKIHQDPAFIIEDKKRYKPWVALTESDRYYSDRYVQYLRMNTNMAKKPIQAMFTDSHYILDRLGNPQSKMPFKRKGLVVGHVQSGKTANYISLINLAADYGYKLIIPQDYSNQRITLRINKKEDLKTIVQLISEMYNLKFEINEDLKQITFQ